MFQPTEQADIQERIDDLLQDGLTAQEAVQVSLLNNPDLRVALFEIGLRRADVVQSGLLSNPSLGALVRFPTEGGGTDLEANLVENLIELWHLPPRRRLAEAQLERTILEIAHTAAITATEARGLYYRAAAAAETLTVEEQNLGTAREFLELTLDRQLAGASTVVDANAARSASLQQEVLVRSARLVAFEAKLQLALLLGLDVDSGGLELADVLLAPPDCDVGIDRLLAVAVEYHLDLRAARKGVEAAERAVELERRYWLRQVRAGVSLESQDGNVALGPVVQLELPLFDQNQAQIAKAEYRHAQALERAEALAVSTSQQVRGAHQRYSVAHELASLYR